MKTDRLIALTIYLLNREVVSAAALAKRFEVSKRTIQRDIEVLNQAGIPIVSAYGTNGGYEILDGFKLAKQIAGVRDYANIITALKGLGTAFQESSILDTLEKTLSFIPEDNQHIFMDLSAAREGIRTEEYLLLMDKAITTKTLLSIEYTDANLVKSRRQIEPLALSYQWYSWYLFAYCLTKEDYRCFKLQRITKCEIIPGIFRNHPENIELLMQSKLSLDTRNYNCVRLLCNRDIKSQALEYFPTSVREDLTNGDIILTLQVPYERMWFSLLMGFGNQIQVLEPEELKIRLALKAKEILTLYQ